MDTCSEFSEDEQVIALGAGEYLEVGVYIDDPVKVQEAEDALDVDLCYGDADVGPFRLSYVFLMTFTERVKGGRRELILRGNDLFLRKGRRLVAADVPLICRFLHLHPEVVSVDLAYNSIGDQGMVYLVHFLMDHDSVRRLNVMCNDIGWRAAEQLAQLRADLPLTSLRINGNPLGARGGRALALLLVRNTRLVHLDVAESDQTLSSLAYVTAVLRRNASLRLLDVSRPLGRYMMVLCSQHWAESVGLMLKANTGLRELHMQKSALTDADAELLVLGLRHNRTLRLLDVSCNQLGNGCAAPLGEYLRLRPPLMALVLGHNQVGDMGARELSYALPSSRLQLLDLSHNHVTDEGVTCLLHTVKKAVMLRHLYVWGNTITHATCQILRRLQLSGVLHELRLDLRIYRVDGVDHVAYLPSDREQHVYYCEPHVATPQPRRPRHPRPMPIPTERCPRIPVLEGPPPLEGRVCPYMGAVCPPPAQPRDLQQLIFKPPRCTCEGYLPPPQED